MMAGSNSDGSKQKLALLEGLSEECYRQIKHSLSSHECLTSEGDRARYAYSNNDYLSDVLRTEIYSRVFSKLPLRLIDLRSGERKLTSRSVVAEYLTSPEKLKAGVEEIVRKEGKGFRNPMTAVQRDQLRDKAIANWVEEATKFAIFSHTWEPGELSYEDFRGQNDLSGSHLHQQNSAHTQSLEKLRTFCGIAEGYGIEFAWADNVCIDKSSSAEQDESIRSMFSWYREAAICVVHLSQTKDPSDLVRDRWFTRGWTLQELLAPRRLKFYSQDWHPLTKSTNDKMDVEHLAQGHSIGQRLFRQLDLLGCIIHKATGLTMKQVCHFTPGIRDPSVPERMVWIARRTTTREEDESYSLMGIFNVSIPIAYGEGRERAFFRLFRAILQVGYERDWFLWTGKSVSPSIHPSRMIPSSPKCYLSRKADRERHPPEWGMVRALEKEPLSLTNVGLPMKILFVPAHVWEPGKPSCPDPPPQAFLECPLFRGKMRIGTIHRDDEGTIGPSVPEEFALGILNVDPEERSVPCPDHLYAVLLRRAESRGDWRRCNMDKIIVLQCDDKSKISNPDVESLAEMTL